MKRWNERGRGHERRRTRGGARHSRVRRSKTQRLPWRLKDPRSHLGFRLRDQGRLCTDCMVVPLALGSVASSFLGSGGRGARRGSVPWVTWLRSRSSARTPFVPLIFTSSLLSLSSTSP